MLVMMFVCFVKKDTFCIKIIYVLNKKLHSVMKNPLHLIKNNFKISYFQYFFIKMVQVAIAVNRVINLLKYKTEISLRLLVHL